MGAASALQTGSPPRVRGKEAKRNRAHCTQGITPARAGKRVRKTRFRCARRDHPRACGEKFVGAPRRGAFWGSPPRVRGKETLGRCCETISGITPARAGKSSYREGSAPPGWDHPRACGEKVDCRLERLPHSGSPPRVRGKAFMQTKRAKTKGITPARAGKSGKDNQE